MWFLLDSSNQIVGTADKQSEIPSNYQGVESDAGGDIQDLYFDGTKISSKPDKPDNTYWDPGKKKWKGVFVPLTADLTLDQIKEAKRVELSALCAAQIATGFTSNALGTTFGYGGALVDQVNLIGSVVLGTDVVYVCTNLQTSLKGAYPHTAAQIKKVLADGSIAKLALIQKNRTLADSVLSAKDAKKVSDITW